jgi:hypothetical protein
VSQTFSIACPETKKRLWIGQGRGDMSVFYTADPDVMERLRRFLNAHVGKPLFFVCCDTILSVGGEDWDEFEEFEDPDEAFPP